MKRLFTMILASAFIQTGAGCSTYQNHASENSQTQVSDSQMAESENDTVSEYPNDQEDIENMKNITVTVGDESFSALLYDTESAAEFYDMLPLTLEMNELNGNEKYSYLDEDLPVDAYNPKIINSGDIMLFGKNCLVLFYDTFQSGYSYTNIGKLENAEGLYKAVGKGNITVTFAK